MASKEQNVILITGANGGIGFELASQLLADAKNFVLLGARSAEKGQAAVQDMKKRNLPGTVEFVQIDVSDEKSIAKAAEEVGGKVGRVDAIVNNAGITMDAPPATGSLFSRINAAIATNASGPAAVVDAFTPLLEKSTHSTPRIVNISSGAGSITMRLDATNPFRSMISVPYRTSKAALNMVTACQAYELGQRGWKVFIYCPGFTVSNLSEINTPEKGARPTSEGARPIVDILEGKKDEHHGTYLNANGNTLPW